MFSLICVWINAWINNREAGDLRRYHAHYDVTVMDCAKIHDWLEGLQYLQLLRHWHWRLCQWSNPGGYGEIYYHPLTPHTTMCEQCIIIGKYNLEAITIKSPLDLVILNYKIAARITKLTMLSLDLSYDRFYLVYWPPTFVCQSLGIIGSLLVNSLLSKQKFTGAIMHSVGHWNASWLIDILQIP